MTKNVKNIAERRIENLEFKNMIVVCGVDGQTLGSFERRNPSEYYFSPHPMAEFGIEELRGIMKKLRELNASQYPVLKDKPSGGACAMLQENK